MIGNKARRRENKMEREQDRERKIWGERENNTVVRENGMG
jgi:hypothetical protein